MAQPVPTKERIRRKLFMDELVQNGYSALGAKGDMPSAAQEGKRRDGVNYARWIRDEQKILMSGKVSYLPSWIDVEGVPVPASLTTPSTPSDHAKTRAANLSAAVSAVITSSRYPVINPDAILISSHTTERYDRKTGTQIVTEAAPRTWLTDTLLVAPVSDSRNKKFIFTSAQNDSPIHEGFWSNLNAYANWVGAEIVVGPWTMVSSWFGENAATARSYDKHLTEYLCFGQMAIGDNFVFCGEMNTLSTANEPISDLLTYSRNRWAVFPHAKRQLKSVPSTDPNIQSHQVMTTGSVTKPKVIPRKAGIKSLFHSVIGAVIVEFDEKGNPFCRQLTATDDGAFYDLDRHISNGAITEGNRVRALVCGDIHMRKLDKANALATFGFDINDTSITCKNNILDTLNPEYVMLHDVLDHESRNHHNASDPGHGYEMHIRGRDSVLSEIVQVGEFIKSVASPDREIIVVESNHDIGLDRYIREGRYRNDPPNIRIGLKLEEMMLEARTEMAMALDRYDRTPKFSLLESAIKFADIDMTGVSWSYDGQSKTIDGIEVGHHGFRGSNGAKGTIKGFANAGRKLSCGDKHTPEINEGVYVAGCMNLQHGYNKGLSSWAIAHILHYQDGSRSIITLQDGKWRPEKLQIKFSIKMFL